MWSTRPCISSLSGLQLCSWCLEDKAPQAAIREMVLSLLRPLAELVPGHPLGPILANWAVL